MLYSNYDKIWSDYIDDITIYDKDIIPFVKDDFALDIGSGSGRLTRYLKTKFVTVETCDIDTDYPADYRSIFDIQDKKYDFIIFGFNTANYILDIDELQKHIEKAKELLNEDGYLVLDMCGDNNFNGEINGIRWERSCENDMVVTKIGEDEQTLKRYYSAQMILKFFDRAKIIKQDNNGFYVVYNKIYK